MARGHAEKADAVAGSIEDFDPGAEIYELGFAWVAIGAMARAAEQMRKRRAHMQAELQPRGPRRSTSVAPSCV